MEQLLLKAKTVARLTEQSISQVFTLARRGDLPCVRIGRAVRFRPEAVREWVRRYEAHQQPATADSTANC